MNKLFIVLPFIFLQIFCNEKSSGTTEASPNFNIDSNRIDSIKWMFYAYTFDGKALFTDEGLEFDFNPVQCDLRIDHVEKRNDTFSVNMMLDVDGYKYSHIYNTLMIYGFSLFQGVAFPKTGMVNLNGFQDIYYAKFHNNYRDSLFRNYLFSIDTSGISKWLLKQAKFRNVIR